MIPFLVVLALLLVGLLVVAEGARASEMRAFATGFYGGHVATGLIACAAIWLLPTGFGVLLSFTVTAVLLVAVSYSLWRMIENGFVDVRIMPETQ